MGGELRWFKLVDGEVVAAEDLLDWARWFETPDNRQIAFPMNLSN